MTRQHKMAGAVLILGAVFLAVGVAQGGYTDALRKAMQVCLECIGIG